MGTAMTQPGLFRVAGARHGSCKGRDLDCEERRTRKHRDHWDFRGRFQSNRALKQVKNASALAEAPSREAGKDDLEIGWRTPVRQRRLHEADKVPYMSSIAFCMHSFSRAFAIPSTITAVYTDETT